jgi:hypothetical protein
MRTRIGTVAASAALVLALGACGDDGGDEGRDTSEEARDEVSVEDALADDPTLEDCQDALRTVLGRVEVPEGFDPADGVDDDERQAAADALDEAAEGFFDPDDEDHPCNDRLDEMSAPEIDEFMTGLDLDPVIIAMLGSQATAEFTPIEDEL